MQRANQPKRPACPGALDTCDGQTQGYADREGTPTRFRREPHPHHAGENREEKSRHQGSSTRTGLLAPPSTASLYPDGSTMAAAAAAE